MDEDRDGAGHTGEVGEGGGSMSGRGQEAAEPRGGEDPREAAEDGFNSGEASAARPGAGGVATSLQPGGTLPGGGPGASEGSIGTGGGQTGGAASGSLKRGGV